MDAESGYASLSLTHSSSEPAATRVDTHSTTSEDAQRIPPVSKLNLTHLTLPVLPDHCSCSSRYVPVPGYCPTSVHSLQSDLQDHSPSRPSLPQSGRPAGLTLPTRLGKNPKSRSNSVDVASKKHQAYLRGHMHTASATPSFLSLPEFQTEDTNSSTSTSGPHSNPSNRRSPSLSASVRSLSQKRKPPASHSSYGIETTNGPPPSYSTQKKLSQDRLRNGERSPGVRAVNTFDYESTKADIVINSHDHNSHHTTTFDDIDYQLNYTSQTPVYSSIDISDDHISLNPVATSGMATSNKRDTVILHEGDMDKTITAPALAASLAADPDNGQDDVKGSSSDEHKSEDLFLNIAKADTLRLAQPTPRNGQRRSRISLPFFSSSRPSSSHRSSPLVTPHNNDMSSSRSEIPPSFRTRSSLGPHIPGALSRSYIDDTSSYREKFLDSRSQVEPLDDSSRTMKRRFSNTNTDTLRPPTRPSASRIGRVGLEANYSERVRPGDLDATESTISTTAPSTVWDELDDLKSRIRKLELTGKLPPSSAAAMTSVERPRTATTAATTLSTSPKHQLAAANIQSAVEGIPHTVHPLLHEALANAKTVISPEVYQKLQATAQDALQLSTMMSGDGVSGFGNATGLSLVTERQIRRRTESMCRSLTELSIAMLAESRTTVSPANRPASRDAMAGSITGLRNRRPSNEPSERPQVASRVQSRLENRRRSLHVGELQSLDASHPAVLQTPPITVASLPNSSARTSRVSSSTRHRRAQGLLDGSNEAADSSPLARPASRAMTEGGTYRQKARDTANFSREYTKQHPLPGQADSSVVSRSPLSSGLSSNYVARRAFASPASVLSTQDSSPITPAARNAPAWGNITIERCDSSPAESTPDNGSAARGIGARRSLGFASRISNVGSRLRAVRGDRTGNGKDAGSSRSNREMTPSQDELENQSREERYDSQADEH